MWAMPREWNPITATLIRSFGLSCARTVRMAVPATAALPALDRKSRRVVRDIVFLKRLQAEGTVYRAFRQKEGLRTSLLSGLAELAVDLLLPLKELAQRLIFRATEQNVCGAFFEAVARLDLFWFPDDDVARPVFPILSAITDASVGIGAPAGLVIQHDEAVAVALLEVQKRQPGRVDGDRLFFEQWLAFVEGSDAPLSVASWPRQMGKELIHRHFVVAKQSHDQRLLDGHPRPKEEVRRSREKPVLGFDLHFRVIGEIACAAMNVGISLALFPKLLHGMPRADPLIALRADALEVRRPVHAVFSAKQGHAELLVCQSAQRPAVLFFILNVAA